MQTEVLAEALLLTPKCLFLEPYLLCVFEDLRCYLSSCESVPSGTSLELCQLFPKGNLGSRTLQVIQLTQGSRIMEDGTAAL